jgi:AraC family transcriptional regulator
MNSRAEYLARIHRAQDYIEQNLNEPLSLDDVAAAARFSPYHFHRVFSAVTGETLYQFILRLRLEKAAGKLVQNPDQSITEIALDAGFSSSATFARAFRAYYGRSASDFRTCGVLPGPGMIQQESKNRKTLSKGSKAEHDGFEDTEDVQITGPLTRSIIMPVAAKSVVVEVTDAMLVAYVRHIGPYAGDGALFGRLFGKLMAWAGPRGFLGPNTKMLTIYHDNPDITEATKLRISCCIPVPAGTKAEGEIGVLEIAKDKYAKATFEIQPEDYGGAWQWFMAEWMPGSGYQPADGMCYELYLNDPKSHPEGKHVVQLTMPVKPL